MKSASDPPRMTDSTEVAPELRGLLDKVRGDGLSPDRAKELALAVQVAISSGGGSGGEGGRGGGGGESAGQVAKGTSLALGAKVVAAVVVAGAVAGLWLARPGKQPAAPSIPRGVATIAASMASAQPPAESPVARVDAMMPQVVGSSSARPARSEPARPRGAARAPSAKANASSEAPEGSSMPQEVPLLRAAREALSTDPERSFALAQEHARRFPNGVLAQEREVIAIEALAKLGRIGAAQQRASQFTEQYPASPHRARVRAAISAGSSGGMEP